MSKTRNPGTGKKQVGTPATGNFVYKPARGNHIHKPPSGIPATGTPGNRLSHAQRRAGCTVDGAARKDFAAEAFDALLSTMRNGEVEANRLAAANAVLNRIEGTPRQTIESSGPGGGPMELMVTHERGKAAIASVQERLRRLTVEDKT